MKTRLLAFAAMMSVGLLVDSSGNAADTKDAPTIEQLLDRIKKLEARVEQLEKRQMTTPIPHQHPVPYKLYKPGMQLHLKHSDPDSIFLFPTVLVSRLLRKQERMGIHAVISR